MCGRRDYTANLALASSVATTPGCVIECGVWKGGSSAGMAEILGPDREYFLFDSFGDIPRRSRLTDPQR